MSARSRFIKVRVSDTEYRALRQRADTQGVTMSEHVRATVTTVHKSEDVAAELAELRKELRGDASPMPASVGLAAPEQREMLLLLRELAAARDAQILVRVRAKLATRVGGDETRRGAT